ncbi:hypothetical protein BDV27DRAFT_156423 [Aspergillus caelatus]|uniref:Dickkopf N-terminal cysteine-rich domain-containing protein n=1 Tax=Aspergillus caelatus TaxID=61420 RepID=A0A5N7A8M7_9EURO|nr:uncharacterized protein BDV27DRAFT_156423 [Aspergillus caelatus]KAE8365993.1 hypothetical protein BDV27DRAFT_156423 [Aspergillus caelatus]
MMLYIISLFFLCNLVASLNPVLNVQDDGGKQLPKFLCTIRSLFVMTERPSHTSTASSISQPCRDLDNQDPCEPASNWLTGDTNEDDERICFSNADCSINFHCHLGHCIRTPRDSFKRVVRDNLQGKYCVLFIPFSEGRVNQKLTPSPALQLASVEPVSTVLQGTIAGVEAASRSPVPLPSHFSIETTMVNSPLADAQRCKHVTDCPRGKWCMDGFCWPFDQSTKLAARGIDIENSDNLKTRQRCHLHVHCGPTGLCIHGWCQYVSNAMSQDGTESVGVGNEVTEERDMLGPRKCTSDRECYPRALCVNGRCNHSHGGEDDS